MTIAMAWQPRPNERSYARRMKVGIPKRLVGSLRPVPRGIGISQMTNLPSDWSE